MKQGLSPGQITTVLFPELLPEPLPDPLGGPQEGVSGEIGANPGSEEPGGGPQEGVSGEIGANPGSEEPGGGPQEGVSGEIGANPGSEVSIAWTSFVENPFLSIYIGRPFCLIAFANGILYHIAKGAFM